MGRDYKRVWAAMAKQGVRVTVLPRSRPDFLILHSPFSLNLKRAKTYHTTSNQPLFQVVSLQ
jgi:hypothetical protein